jgi:hypothetical protein
VRSLFTPRLSPLEQPLKELAARLLLLQPTSPQLPPPRSLVLSQGWGLIDLPLCTFHDGFSLLKGRRRRNFANRFIQFHWAVFPLFVHSIKFIRMEKSWSPIP